MKYNYFYKTTNIINSKYYYGVHSTNNISDGYLGSGLLIKKAIRKYGKGNFKKEILKTFNNRSDLMLYEKSIITEDVIIDKNSYNLSLGGYGGGYTSWYENLNEIERESHKNKIRNTIIKKYQDDPTYKKRISESVKRAMKKIDMKTIMNRPEVRENIRKNCWDNKEVRAKISKANKGRIKSEEWRRKIGEANKGRLVSKETRKKIKKALANPEIKEKLSKASKGRIVSEETRKNISKAQKGKIRSKEVKESMSKNRQRGDNGNSKMVYVNGKIFPCKRDVQDFFNISRYILDKRLNSDSDTWKNWYIKS